MVTGTLAGIGQAAGSTAVNKIAGNGVVYLKKNGMGCKIKTTSGKDYIYHLGKHGNSYIDGLVCY